MTPAAEGSSDHGPAGSRAWARTPLTRLYGWLVVTSTRRAELVWGALFSSAVIAIITATLAALWVAALPDGQRIAGYDARDMVWYLAIAEAAVNAVDQRLMLRIGESLRRGDLTIELLRPVTPVWMLVSRELGRSIARFALSMPACCAVAWAIVGPAPSWSGLALVAITGPLATIVHTLFIVGASSSALWLGDATAAWFVVQKLFFLLGGMLLPLELWPEPVGDVLTALPWAAAAYAPAHLAVHPDAGRALLLVALQLAWIVLLGAACARLWARGERRMVGAGA